MHILYIIRKFGAVALVHKDNSWWDGTVVYKDEVGNTITAERCNQAHSGLMEAFGSLVPHLAILCEQREADQIILNEGILPDGLDKKLEVTGISGRSSVI